MRKIWKLISRFVQALVVVHPVLALVVRREVVLLG